MARSQFKIDNEQDASHAWHWIKNQFKGLYFPYEDSRETIDAENEYKELNWRDSEGLNTWCEKHLKKEDWKKLKGAIRSKRLKVQRGQGKTQMIIGVDLTSKAHTILKSLSKHYGVTLSEVIIKYMENDWLEIPLEDD